MNSVAVAIEDSRHQGASLCRDQLTSGSARGIGNESDLPNHHLTVPIGRIIMAEELEAWAGKPLDMATIWNCLTTMLHRQEGIIVGIDVVTHKDATKTTWKKASMRDLFMKTTTTRIIQRNGVTPGVGSPGEIAEGNEPNACLHPRESCRPWAFQCSGKSVDVPATIMMTMTPCAGMSTATTVICCKHRP